MDVIDLSKCPLGELLSDIEKYGKPSFPWAVRWSEASDRNEPLSGAWDFAVSSLSMINIISYRIESQSYRRAIDAADAIRGPYDITLSRLVSEDIGAGHLSVRASSVSLYRETKINVPYADIKVKDDISGVNVMFRVRHLGAFLLSEPDRCAAIRKVARPPTLSEYMKYIGAVYR